MNLRHSEHPTKEVENEFINGRNFDCRISGIRESECIWTSLSCFGCPTGGTTSKAQLSMQGGGGANAQPPTGLKHHAFIRSRSLTNSCKRQHCEDSGHSSYPYRLQLCPSSPMPVTCSSTSSHLCSQGGSSPGSRSMFGFWEAIGGHPPAFLTHS